MCSRDSCTLTKLRPHTLFSSWLRGHQLSVCCGKLLHDVHITGSNKHLRPKFPGDSEHQRRRSRCGRPMCETQGAGDKMWTQIDPAHAHEATLPPTNQNLPQYHFIPAGTPTAHAVGRRGGVLSAEGTTHCAPHNSSLSTLAANELDIAR